MATQLLTLIRDLLATPRSEAEDTPASKEQFPTIWDVSLPTKRAK
ncbi:hypothetical protein [Franzmannia qiaohouensis]|uniref:Uncharacterized protein n=1 Tax=Franzmannia qiaohouensis TaxID=1329370 RepID=A0ABU1HFJ0_9GAMM|nr:hypothetical protein [Halomonas qiaohouensis]MDR5906234.1 hypothetical protein [Halomonas qiaohouensis]